MADIRINALATTAASTASDDFVAVDGSANGTRKLNAYSPTFGGNLTVSGTGTNNFSGSVLIAKALTTDFGSLNVSNDLGSAATVLLAGVSGSGRGGTYFGQSEANSSIIFSNGTSSNGLLIGSFNAKQVVIGTNNTAAISINGTTQATTLAGNLTVSGTGTSSVAGSLQANGGTAQSVNTPALRIGNDKILVWLDSSSTTTNAGFLWYDSSNILRIGAENGTRIQVSAATTTISNNLTVSGTGGITVNPNQNAQTLVKVSNANAGASADSTFQLANNSSTTNWGMRSTGAAAYFALDAGSSYLWYNGTTSLVIGATDAAGIIKFNTGGLSERMRLNASGNLLIGTTTDGGQKLQVSGTAAISGALSIGNTVQTAVSVASTHKVTVVIGGVTYYLLATNV